MQITHLKTGIEKNVVIELISTEDYKVITKKRYWFNWKTEKENKVTMKTNKVTCKATYLSFTFGK